MLASIAVPDGDSASRRSSRPDLQELIDAASTLRPLEGRLTGGFAWAAAAVPQRGGGVIPPALQIAAARLELAHDARRTPASLADYASGQALIGNLDAAIQALEEATAQAEHAEWWSDLSAVYLARAVVRERAVDFPFAVEAASRAITLNPGLREARFNRAVALSRLGLTVPAERAWVSLLETETDPDWRAEAEARLHGNRDSPQSVDAQTLREEVMDKLLPHWALSQQERGIVEAGIAAFDRASGDRELAGAMRDAIRQQDLAVRTGLTKYGEGRALYKIGKYAAAKRLFEDSARRLSGHPVLAAWSMLHVAIIEYLEGNLRSASRIFEALVNDEPRSPTYRGHLDWMRGMILVLKGKHQESLRTYQAAVDAFEAGREPINAEFVRGLIGENYDWLGNVADAWNARLGALRLATRPGNLLSAAVSARGNGWTAFAADVQAQAAAKARELGRLSALVDALRDQALTSALAGDSTAAASLLGEAADLIANDPDPTRDRQRAEIDLARAACRCMPAVSAIEAGDRAVAFFSRNDLRRKLPEAYLARAQAHRAHGNRDQARHDLHTGFVLAGREAEHPVSAATPTLGGEFRRLSDALVILELEDGNELGALAGADRGRARNIGSEGPLLDRTAVAQLVADLPRDTTATYFHHDGTQLLIWTARNGKVRLQKRFITGEALARRVRAFARNPLNGSLGRELSELLFSDEPAGGRLVLMADGALHGLPFAALPLRDGSYLFERAVIEHSPHLRGLQDAARGSSLPHIVTVIANPAIDRSRFSQLANLPGAEREADAIAGRYARSEIARGAAATRARLFDALKSSDVVHFAGHAVVNEVDPLRSELVVADAAVQPLRATEIATVRKPRARLVVLSACSAASGIVTKSEGPVGLARSFLAAGVGSVVASLWPVDDAEAAALFDAFHRSYVQTGDAAASLQAGQRAAMKVTANKSRQPAWAGFIVVNGGLRR